MTTFIDLIFFFCCCCFLQFLVMIMENFHENNCHMMFAMINCQVSHDLKKESTSWPPPPDNVHLDEHIHVPWQCWLRNHELSLTKGPLTSLRIHFAEVPFQDTYLDWEPVDEEQRTRNYENVYDIRLIITEADTSGHASDLAWRREIHVLYYPFTS